MTKEAEPVMEAIEQSKYPSGVGMLNYVVKHTRPDLCNAVGELLKVLDKSTT